MASPSTTGLSYTLPVHREVYVRDDAYVWLPARLLELNKEEQTAKVQVTLPSNWHTSTILCDDSTIEDMEDQLLMGDRGGSGNSPNNNCDCVDPTDQVRSINLLHYMNEDLPRRNINLNKRDMADLQYLHEPAILYNLKERHSHSQPYTRVGDIVVAMNPYVWIPNLYTPEMRDLYAQALIWQDEKDDDGAQGFGSLYDKLGFDPHVYEVSCLAYRGLAVDRRDQAILVTGESGAGKTETVKIVLQHLATLEQSRPGEAQSHAQPQEAPDTAETALLAMRRGSGIGEDMERVAADDAVAAARTNAAMATSHTGGGGGGADTVRRVLESSPVFEAFGNAKTIRNDNSSRFGKFTQLQFKIESNEEAKAGGRIVPYCRLAGSTCVTYLLEKSRVVSHSPGERTYHIFYELLAAPPDFKSNLWPWFADMTVDDFKYIADSAEVELQKELEDSTLWPRTLDALKLFSFHDEELYTLMRALGIVLQLGNLTFDYDPTSDVQEGVTIISSVQELELLSDMIGIDADELESAMTLRIIKTAYEEVQVQLRPSAAKESCDALAKEIYSRVFNVLVSRINEYTGAPDPEAIPYGLVSFLDIFGFERFRVNRFEQLCINYANEAMQYKYVLDNFKQVKEDYIDEGIEIFNFSVVDNSSVLQLLEGRVGLIIALNEECVRPNGNDESFVYKIKIVHKEHERLIDEKLHLKTEFGIRHFAGPVKYDSTKFVERNTDKLPDGLLYCAVKTSNTLIQREFQTLIETHESEISAEVVRKKKTHRTVLEKFRSQLKDLMKALEGTKTRYIRCIKPNEITTPRLTDHVNTMRQLECAGLVTAILFSRESYPTKLGYDAVLDRFAPLMNSPYHQKNLDKLTTKKSKANYMLATLLASMVEGSSTFPFACGKTRVYFKAGALEHLETQRQDYYSEKATIVQRWIRAKQGKAKFERVRGAFMRAQAVARAHLERKRYLQKKNAAIVLENWARGQKALRTYEDMRRQNAATKVQSLWRGRTKKQLWDRTKKAVGVLQQAIRNRHNRESFSAKLLVCVEEARMDKKLLELKALVANRGAALPRSGSGRLLEPPVLGEVEKMFDYLRHELFSLRGKNSDLKAALREADDNKRELWAHAQSAEAAAASSRLHMAELARGQVAMTAEIQKQRQESNELRRELRSSIIVREADTAALRKEFERALAEKDQEINNLQKAVRRGKACCEDEKNKLKEDLAAEQERHALEVRRLKSELKNTQDTHYDYLAKLMDVLETTHAQREREAARIAAELNAVRQEKDGQIVALQREVESLRNLRQKDVPAIQRDLESKGSNLSELRTESERNAAVRTGRAKKFHEVAAKLESAMNPESFQAIINKRRGSALARGVSGEEDMAAKMKKMVRYMADLYSLEEASQAKLNKETLAKLDSYLVAAQPTQTIAALERQITTLENHNNELKSAIQQQGCQRCSLRDARRRNMQRNSIARMSARPFTPPPKGGSDDENPMRGRRKSTYD